MDLDRNTYSRGVCLPFKMRSSQGYVYQRYRDYETFATNASYVPTIGLLQGVSRSVQSEAEAIFFGAKNHFIMPVTNTHGRKHLNQAVESVSYSFDMRDVTGTPWLWKGTVNPDLNRLSQNGHAMNNARLHDIHERCLWELQYSWRKRFYKLRSYTKLRYLQLDVEECFCPLGCCRITESVFALLREFRQIYAKPLERLDLIGLSSEEEMARAQKFLAQGQAVNDDTGCVITCQTVSIDVDQW